MTGMMILLQAGKNINNDFIQKQLNIHLYKFAKMKLWKTKSQLSKVNPTMK